jgi:hypothetical protein
MGIRLLRHLGGLTLCLLLAGCLYRSDGAFSKIGKSDYKARINVLNLFVVAEKKPTNVSGLVLLGDHVTPVKSARVTLRKQNDKTIISSSFSDHAGKFAMTANVADGTHVLEVSMPGYSGVDEIELVPPNDYWCEIEVQPVQAAVIGDTHR